MIAQLTQEWLQQRTTPEPNTGCWIWLGSQVYGYALAGIGGRTRRVHRAVLEKSLGRTLRPEEVAMHTCDMPSCVNPSHLKAGTHADNVADRVRKGRGSRNAKRSGFIHEAGPHHPARVISPEQAAWAREAMSVPLPPRRKGVRRPGTLKWAARMLGVSPSGLRDALKVLP